MPFPRKITNLQSNSQRKNKNIRMPVNFSEWTRNSVIKVNWKQFCGKPEKKIWKIYIYVWLVWSDKCQCGWKMGNQSLLLVVCTTFLPELSHPKLLLKIPISRLHNHHITFCVIIISFYYYYYFCLENSEYFASARSEYSDKHYFESTKKPHSAQEILHKLFR